MPVPPDNFSELTVPHSRGFPRRTSDDELVEGSGIGNASQITLTTRLALAGLHLRCTEEGLDTL
jgi:hypothetical protein